MIKLKTHLHETIDVLEEISHLGIYAQRLFINVAIFEFTNCS